MQDHEVAFLRDSLSSCGATGDVLEALITYTTNPFGTTRLNALPSSEASQIEVWEDYARDAHRVGAWQAMASRLVQLQFPIAPGISRTDAYRAATRRGERPQAGGSGLVLEDPGGLDLTLHPTLGGRVPVVTCDARGDFVALVRALACRNEPDAVPDSMGACIVAGLNNWDRVARLRRRREAERGASFDESEWREAFAQIVPDKALYQDRLILLSSDPYSAVPAAALGIDDVTWRALSVSIRREHECTHYFTLVAFGVMRNNLFDELIADCAGLAGAYGRYDASLALRFLGLEAHPQYRAGGRFENYLETPPVPADAVPVLREVVVRAARSIETFTAGMDLSSAPARNSVVLTLSHSSLAELASDSAVNRLRDRLADAHRLLDASSPSR